MLATAYAGMLAEALARRNVAEVLNGGAPVSGYDGRGFALGKKAHSDGFGFLGMHRKRKGVGGNSMTGKLVIAAALTTFSYLAGRAFGGTPSREADSLRMLMDDLQMLRTLTLERLVPMGDALSEMRVPLLRQTGERMRKNVALTPGKAWAETVEAQKGEPVPLPQADAEELERLFQGLEVLGRSEHAEQYARTIERLGRREGDLRAAGREKRRLYASLGAMTGLAVSIL